MPLVANRLLMRLGVSSFTICSERSATSKDVATNFFLQSTSVGQPIAVELVR